MKPHRLSRAADADVVQGYDWYLREAGPDVADRFLYAVQDALEHVARHPGTGSSRYTPLVPNLRFWLLDAFPYMVFYMERPDAVEIVRVLHQARNVPAHLDKN